LSAHSLPIVIGQLRRALGEDARNPQYIETIPKRGYRLLGEGAPEVPLPRSTRHWTIAAAASQPQRCWSSPRLSVGSTCAWGPRNR
jgi:DNA-binding winged helix-turn-helix (wHTH) protein